jgi:hypothetical protein
VSHDMVKATPIERVMDNWAVERADRLGRGEGREGEGVSPGRAVRLRR